MQGRPGSLSKGAARTRTRARKSSPRARARRPACPRWTFVRARASIAVASRRDAVCGERIARGRVDLAARGFGTRTANYELRTTFRLHSRRAIEARGVERRNARESRPSFEGSQGFALVGVEIVVEGHRARRAVAGDLQHAGAVNGLDEEFVVGDENDAAVESVDGVD